MRPGRSGRGARWAGGRRRAASSHPQPAAQRRVQAIRTQQAGTEYLLRTATEEGTLPSISNAVDLINLVSLQSGLPVSLVSLDRVGIQLSLRVGTPGEKFVFNRAGQELDVEGLLCICAITTGGSEPVGTPVKDSMRAKVTEDDRRLLACIYASQNAISQAELSRWAEELGAGFQRFCGAYLVGVAIRS